MSTPEPKTKNLIIRGLSHQQKALFSAFAEIEQCSEKELFEALVWDWSQKFLNQRSMDISVSVELLEAVEEAIDNCYINQIAFHNARYRSMDSISESDRAYVKAKMERQK